MASSPDKQSLMVAAATLACAIAWWFGTGLAPVHWLTWFAPLPLLLVATRTGWRTAGLAALVAGACSGASSWHYLTEVIKLPLPIDLLIVATPAVIFALCVLLYRKLWLDGRLIAATLAMPTLWGAFDYLSSLGSPHGTFGSLAYTQMDALAFIQLATITGLWGVAFLLLLLPSALAVALTPGPAIKLRRYIAGVAIGLVVASFAYGTWRRTEPPLTTVRVGLVSLQGPTRLAPASPEGQAMLQRYLTAIDKLAAQGARTIVLPETAFAIDQGSIPELAESATRHGVLIDAGVAVGNGNSGERNMALAFSPGGQEFRYAKRHLIPGFESQYQSSGDITMVPGLANTGLAICKDMDFHDISHTYAAHDTELLLVPAWDFGADGWMHGRMAIMRGVESGFAIARAARRGRLTLSDDRGHVVAEASDDNGDAMLVGDLPLHLTHTLYSLWGDWFAWLELVMLVMLLLSLYFKRSA